MPPIKTMYGLCRLMLDIGFVLARVKYRNYRSDDLDLVVSVYFSKRNHVCDAGFREFRIVSGMGKSGFESYKGSGEVAFRRLDGHPDATG